jgi:hypothetical protein
MTRSLFDPSGDDVLEEGGPFTPPSGQSHSHLPPPPQPEEGPDVEVPLKGERGEEGLGPAETEELADAAEEARDQANDPDNAQPDPNPPQGRVTDTDDQGLTWIEDI